MIIPCLKAFSTMTQHKINGTALLAGTMSCAAGAFTYIMQGTATVPVAVLLHPLPTPPLLMHLATRILRGCLWPCRCS